MGAFAELKAIFGLDTRPYEAGAKKVESVTSSLQRTLAGVGGMIAGAFSAGAILSFSRRLMDVADGMANMAEATNSTMGAMVAMKTIGAENNLNWEQMSKILAKVRDAQGEVVKLSKEQTEALDKLGINAEAFVGSEIDRQMEMLAKAYVNANGSAEAYNALMAYFGEKIGPRALEMLRALAEEGLDALTARTKDAVDGFNELANAQGTLEKFFNSVQIGAAKAVSVISDFGTMIGLVVFRANKFDNIMGDKISSEAFRKTNNRIATQTAWEDFNKDKERKARVNPDVARMRANKAKLDAESAAKERERVAKEAADANRRAQELGRHYYAAEQKRAEAINDLNSDYRARMAKAGEGVRGDMPAVDRVRAMGGAIGLTRAGISTEDKAVRVAQEQKAILFDMRQRLEDLLAQHERDRDTDE